MAWTTPATAVANTTLTAAFWNTQVRDNFLETSAATAQAAGDIVFADAANSMGSRLAIGAVSQRLVSDGAAPVWRANARANDTGSDTFTNTAYGPLDDQTSFPTSGVTVTLTTGTQALVAIAATVSNNTGGAVTFLSFDTSGATTQAAAGARACWYESSNANDACHVSLTLLVQSLNAGSNTFKLAGRVSSGTGTISFPQITALAL